MAKLSSCSSCHGFLPTDATVCPHCDARVAGSFSLNGMVRGLMATSAGAALSMTLMACYGAGTVIDCTDDDNDGYCLEVDDCNDSNELINPGSEDIAGDGVDHDCDGCDEPALVEIEGDGGSLADGGTDDEPVCTEIDDGTGGTDAGVAAQ